MVLRGLVPEEPFGFERRGDEEGFKDVRRVLIRATTQGARCLSNTRVEQQSNVTRFESDGVEDTRCNSADLSGSDVDSMTGSDRWCCIREWIAFTELDVVRGELSTVEVLALN